MRKFLNYSLIAIAAITLIVGVAMFANSLSSVGAESMGYFTSAIVCVLSSFFILCFSYIVDAAYLYIDLHDDKGSLENDQHEQTQSNSVKA